MSGTDASSFPPSGSKFPEAPRRFPESAARAVDIIALPPALRGRDAPVNVAGRILDSQSEDGTVRIRTDYGEVTVRTKDRVPPPEAGRVVEIEIPSRDAAAPDRAILRSESAPVSRKDFGATENKNAPESTVQAPSHFETDFRNIDTVSQNETSHFETRFRNTAEASQNETVHFEPSAQNFAAPAVRFVPLTPSQLSEILGLVAPYSDVIATLEPFSSMAFLPLPNLTIATTESDFFESGFHANIILLQSVVLDSLSETSGASAVPSNQFASISLARSDSLFEQGGGNEYAFSVDSSAIQGGALISTAQHSNILDKEDISNICNKIIFSFRSDGENSPLPSFFKAQEVPALNAVPVGFLAPSPHILPPSPAGNIVLSQYIMMNTVSTIPHAQAGFLTGTILSKTESGLPIISIALPGSSHETLFVMQAVTPYSMPGTTVLLAPLSPPAQTEIPLIYNTMPDSFEGIWQLLTQSAPHVLADGAARLLPSPTAPNALGPAALLFLAAMRSGDLAGWMGEKAMDALRRIGKSDLATRAAKDLSSLSIQTQDGENGWKTMPLPMAWDGRIHRVALHWRESGGREDSEKDGKNSGKNGARFIFDLTFDRLGPVQLDGLMRGKRLDIALRTTVPLGAAMRQTLSRRYADSIALAGLGGEIHFQTAPESWVKIRSSAPARSSWA